MMPLTDVEVSRLADAAHALRPDFVARSVRAVLTAAGRDHAFADLAVAMAACYADPTTSTPGRVFEAGPWWTATRVNRPGDATFTPGPGRGQKPCRRPGHDHEPANACRLCRAEHLGDDQPNPVEGHAPRPAPCDRCSHPSRFLVDGWCFTCRYPTRHQEAS